MRDRYRKGLATAALAAGLGLGPARAEPVYTAGHGDLGLGYTPGAARFDVHWHLDAGAVVDGQPISSGRDCQPAQLAAFTDARAAAPANAGAWLGVAPGGEVWRLGSDTFPPNLGFDTSGAGPEEDWLDSTLTITLRGWGGANPGEVALRSGSSAGAVTWFSTFAPGATENGDNTWAFDLGVGHVHLAWYFSDPGDYELTFDWAGTYVGGATPKDVTGTGTFGFHVAAIPEPGIWSLLALAGVGLAGRRWRRRGAVLLVGALGLAGPGRAQSVYTDGHGDLGVGYAPGNSAFDVHWHVDAGATVNGAAVPPGGASYAPGDLVASTNARANTPSSSAAWLGVAGATSVYRLGSAPFPPNLGFSSSEAGMDSQWLDSTLVITLSGWSASNPGQVALREGASAGAKTFFSTYAPGATFRGDNSWEFDMGTGHTHLVWYFSKAGKYELEFTWRGTYLGAPGSVYRANPIAVTGVGVFDFYAGVAPVPEPGTWAAGALLAAAVLGRRLGRRA